MVELTKEIYELIELEKKVAKLDSLLSVLKRTNSEIKSTWNSIELNNIALTQENYIEQQIENFKNQILIIKFGKI